MMSVYTYVVTDQLINRKPCKLLSVIVSTQGGGPGIVKVYDSRSANPPDLVLNLLGYGNHTDQFRFDGLEFQKGLYIELVEKADFVTVEWESVN